MSEGLDHKPTLRLFTVEEQEFKEIPEGHFELCRLDPSTGIAIFRGHDGNYFCHGENVGSHHEDFRAPSDLERTPSYVGKFLLRPLEEARGLDPMMWQHLDPQPTFSYEKGRLFTSAEEAVRGRQQEVAQAGSEAAVLRDPRRSPQVAQPGDARRAPRVEREARRHRLERGDAQRGGRQWRPPRIF